jgi:hypothetical protein
MATDRDPALDFALVVRALDGEGQHALWRILVDAEMDGEARAKSSGQLAARTRMQSEVQAQPQSEARPKVRQRAPDGLKTLAEGAAKLGCSVKTVKGYIASGALRYIAMGHGSKRQRRMLADADLEDFIAARSRRDSPACQSIKVHARRSGTSTSSSEVIAFSARRSARLGARPKR